MNDCIFCKIVKKEIPADFVYENNKIVAFLDIHPSNKGHTLVVPKAHFTDLLETPDDVLAEIISKTKKIAPAVIKAVNADGFNTIFNTKPAAGQMVFHTHLHIIPRYTNDGLKHWPEQKTTPEELKKIKESVVNAFGSVEPTSQEIKKAQMKIFCTYCGAPHLDEGVFSKNPHRRHLCMKCKKEFLVSEYSIGI